MFRGTAGEINPTNFGAGSIVKAGEQVTYLVVATDDNVVTFVDLQTMKVLPVATKVENIYHLSKNETRELLNVCFPKYTFSDFDFIAEGLKEQSFT